MFAPIPDQNPDALMVFDRIAPALWWSANDRLHHLQVADRRSTLRTLGFLRGRAVACGAQEAVARAVVHYPRGTGRADPGNVVSTVLKAIIDGLIDAHVLPDDDSTHLRGPYTDRGDNTKGRFYMVSLGLWWLA